MSESVSKQQCHWIGAVYAEDVGSVRTLLAEEPALANFTHPAFDDRRRKVRFPVTTLYFVVNDIREDRTGHRRAIPFDLVELLVEVGADPNLPSAHGLPLTTVADSG